SRHGKGKQDPRRRNPRHQPSDTLSIDRLRCRPRTGARRAIAVKMSRDSGRPRLIFWGLARFGERIWITSFLGRLRLALTDHRAFHGRAMVLFVIRARPKRAIAAEVPGCAAERPPVHQNWFCHPAPRAATICNPK